MHYAMRTTHIVGLVPTVHRTVSVSILYAVKGAAVSLIHFRMKRMSILEIYYKSILNYTTVIVGYP